MALFVTCLVDLMRPRIASASLRLLEAAGASAVVPAGQTCCGQPAWNAGAAASARALARKTIVELEPYEAVVVPSGSCAGMIRVHYPRALADDAHWRARAERVAAKTFELTEFLAPRLAAPPARRTGPVTYHDCCSGLRELGIKAQPRALLARVPGLELREMRDSETCCGFGGSFAVKFGAVSCAMASAKCAAARATGASALVLGDLGCLLHLEGRLRREGGAPLSLLHVAELLGGIA